MARCDYASRCRPGHDQFAPQSRSRLPPEPASTSCFGASRCRSNRRLLPDWRTHRRSPRTHHRAARHNWTPDTVCHLIPGCADNTPTIVMARLVTATSRNRLSLRMAGTSPAMMVGRHVAGICTLSWCPRAGSVTAKNLRYSLTSFHPQNRSILPATPPRATAAAPSPGNTAARP